MLSSLIAGSSTGPDFSKFTRGGLQFSIDELRDHAYCFDLETVQTQRTSDSCATPQRPTYDVIQTALMNPNQKVCMRYVLFWLRMTNYLVLQQTHPARALLDFGVVTDSWKDAQMPSPSTNNFAFGLRSFVQKRRLATLS